MPDVTDLQAALDAPADAALTATPEADSAAVEKLMGVLDDSPPPAPAPVADPAPETAAAPAEEKPAPVEEGPAPELTDKSLLSDEEKPAEEAAKPEEKPAEEAPKPEEPKAEEKAPEPEPEKPYEIELPEGLKPDTINKEVFDKFKAVMAESKVPPEKAKEILSFYQNEMNKAVSTTFEKANEQFARLKEGWKLESEEAFGNRKETAMHECRTVLKTYIKNDADRSAVMQMLGETGLGNNLRFLNFLQNIYNQNLREGSLSSSSEVRSAQRGSPQNTSELANVLFDN